MANNTFNIDDYLTPAPSVGNSPEQSQQFQSFNIDDYLDITDKDITGLGKKQAAEFGNQLAKFSHATPVQQYQAFEKYGQQYQNHLAQQGYSPTQIAQALTEFNANADPRNQTGLFEYYIGDRGNDVMIGTGNLIGDALAAVPEAIPVLGQWADNAEKYVKNTTKAWQNDLSAKNQINTYLGEKAYQDKRAEGASEFSATLSSLYENPMQVTSLITQQVPQLLLGAAGTATLAGVNMAGAAGRDRKDIEEAYEKTFKENPEQLLKLPEIQERMAQGMTFEQAVNDAKTDVSDHWKSILASALIGGTEALSPLGKFGQGVNRGVLKTLGKEMGQEALQEGAEQLNSNLAVGEIDGKTGAFDEVVRNATLGAVAGLGTGIPTAIEAGLNGRTESDADINQILNRSAESAKNANAKAQGEFQRANSTNTQSTSEKSSVDEQILESVVSGVADEELRNQYFDELKSSIQDGSIVQAAEQNTAFGRFAKAYMDQTQAKASVEPQITQPEKPLKEGKDYVMVSTDALDMAKIRDITDQNINQVSLEEIEKRAKDELTPREYREAVKILKSRKAEDYDENGELIEKYKAPQQAIENPQNVVNQPTAAELQQTANVAPTQPRNVVTGTQDTVDIGENNYQPFQYEVMEAEDLLPTQQKAGNQLRDRERTASQAQVNKIARNLDPRKLVDSPTMDMGAPLLAQDGKTVIAGNGRSMALRQAYQEGNADGYKQYLQANAGKFGLDANQIAGMKNPVLVRRLNTAVDIKQTAINSNEQGGMRMSNLEQAKVDAGRLPNMASFELGENGEINTTANQVFISQFIQNQPETLRNELLDGKGNLSQTGVQRLRNAMLYTAYGDTDTLARAVESTDQGARNIINALTRIAPKVAQVKQDIANGILSDVDISADIVSAVEKYNQLRSQNKDVGEYLQQQDFVSELTPEAKTVLRIFNENNRSAKRISDILTGYYNSAETQGNTAQSSMFGDVDFDKAGTLEQAKNTDDIRYSQSPKSTEENIARGSQAMEQAIQYHQDVQNAMFRDGVGWIDFIWGTEGVVKESGKTKGAKGVSHIIEARMRKDNLSYAEAVAFLTQQVPDIIANGRIERDYEISGTRAIAIIRTDGSEVHLIKKGSDNAWLLTGFEPKENQQMNQSRGATTSDLRSNSPIRSRTDEGAVGTDNVQQSTQQRNSQITQDQQTLSRILGEETASHIQVVDRNTQVPSGRDVKQLATKGVEGWFEPSTQKLYIISDNITANDVLSRDERLAWVAFHELAHAGVRIKYGHLLTNVLASASQNVVVKVLARKIQAEHGYEREIAIEEAMMEIYAAYETGNWAELESRYKTKIHESYKQGKNSVGDFLTRVANALRRLIGGIIGKDLTQTMTTSQVFDTLRGIQQGINDIAKTEQNQTASENGNIRYSFAGKNAQNADKQSLGKAVRLDLKNTNSEDIRQKTGWFRGTDKKWRFEIDDSQASVTLTESEIANALENNKYYRLSYLLEHPQLFEAYPDLKMMGVIFDNSIQGGAFSDDAILIGTKVQTPRDLKSLLLHEIQHAIQESENFARGSSPGYFMRQGFDEETAYEKYIHSSGEVEARNVQLRMDMSSAERKSVEPFFTQDVHYDNEDVFYPKTGIAYSLNEEPSSEFAKAVPKRQANSFDQVKTLAKSFLNKPLHNNETGIEAIISRANLDKMLSGKAHAKSTSLHDHLLAVANVDMLFENAIHGWTEPYNKNSSDDVVGVHKMFAPLNIDGNVKLVKLTVKELKPEQGNRVYSVETIEIGNEKAPVPEMAELGFETNSHRLHEGNGDNANVQSLIQRIKDFNSSNENSDNIRYSVKQSAMEQAKSGKSIPRETLLDQALSLDMETYKTLFQKGKSKVAEQFADSKMPVIDFINQWKNVKAADKQRIIQALQRAEITRDTERGKLEQVYTKPILEGLVEFTKDSKLDLFTIKRLVGFWISARWSIEKNQMLLEQDRKAMDEAKAIYDSALANSQDSEVIDRADLDYRRAKRQYENRKHDVELDLGSDYSNKAFKVGTAGGWSIPEAKLLMQYIEQRLPVDKMKVLAEKVYDLNQALLKLDNESGRYTDEQLAEYSSHRHYVPLTGDNGDSDIDFIGGVAQKAFNIGKDKRLLGRKNSEAEDAFDAVWKSLGKTTQYYGWADFKHGLAETFDNRVAELKKTGLAEKTAKELASEELGFSKTLQKGSTRTSDDALIFKEDGKYYEMELPPDVAGSLRGDNLESTATPFMRALNWLLTKPTRLMARGVTQLTVDFPIINMVRDIMGKAIYIAHEPMYDANGNEISVSERYKIGFSVYKEAVKSLLNPKDNLFAATFKHAWGAKLNNTGLQADLQELIDNGGFSTFTNNIARSEADFVKQLKTQNSQLRKGLAFLAHLLNTWSGMFDAVSSLATYRALKANGIDAEQAAGLVLETANFNKKGASLTNARGMYMFLQPKMMDAQKMMQILSTKRGVAELTARTVVMSGLYAALGSFWAYVLGDDEDKDEGGYLLDQLGDITGYIPIPLSEGMRNLISEWTGLENIKGNYFKLHLGFGMNQLAWNMAFNLNRAATGSEKWGDALVNIAMNWTKNFAPVTPSEISATSDPLNKLGQTIMPSSVLPLFQVATNKTAFGSSITATNVNSEEVKATQAKPNTAPEWEAASSWILDNLGIDMHPETVKHLVTSYSIMAGSAREYLTVAIENPNRERLGKTQRIPVLNRIFGMPNENSIPNKYYEYSNQIKESTRLYNRYKEIGDVEKMSGLAQEVKFGKILQDRYKPISKEKTNLKKQLNEGKLTQQVYDNRMLIIRRKEEAMQRQAVRMLRQSEGLTTN